MSEFPSIIFFDNKINKIYRSIDIIKSDFPFLEVFTEEKEFLQYLDVHHPQVVMLNLDLQPRDAIALLNELRHQVSTQSSFFIIYSEKQDDFIQELAFNSGADGFINFHEKPNILRLFLRNLLRRKLTIPKRKKAMIIDPERYMVIKKGEPIQLPKKEFILFSYLNSDPDKFFTKTEIAEHVWQDELVAKKRTIDVHVYKIRQLLGDRIIISKKGEGYRINKKLIS